MGTIKSNVIVYYNSIIVIDDLFTFYESDRMHPIPQWKKGYHSILVLHLGSIPFYNIINV